MPATETAMRKDPLYTISGTITDVAFKTTSKGKPYGIAMLAGMLAGKAFQRRVMVFGPMVESIRPQFIENAHITFIGALDGGSVRIVKLPDAKLPANDVAPVAEPEVAPPAPEPELPAEAPAAAKAKRVRKSRAKAA